MIFRKIIFLPVSLLAVVNTTAQTNARISASVDKQKILIGEPMVLTIKAEWPANSTIRFTGIDSIAHFELTKDPEVDSSGNGSGITIKAIYTITSFDSGRWSIPSFSLSKDVRSDTIPVDVVFSDFDPAKDYHDIKDILEVEEPKKKTPWWWYAAGGAVILALLIYFLLRKKKPVTAVSVPKMTISPLEEAMKDLEQLRRNKPGAKEFHSRLTDIFKLYVFRKKGILSLQKTTDDLVLQLKDLGFEKQQFDQLSQSLRLGDFVKFAKYIPSAEDDDKSFADILRAIETMEQTVT